MKDPFLRRFVICLAMAQILMAPAAWSYTITSYATVQKDGALKVRGRTIYLYGIYIPPTERVCRTYVSPVKCGPRAVMALEYEIGARFVHCEEVQRFSDGSMSAVCKVDGTDLSAWMLQNGWAVALPDAPFEYQTFEKIARTRGIGIWGIPVGGLP